MTTEQIIWTVVIVVAALALIGFIVASMRKKSHEADRARAAELREQADSKATVIPDADARAREAEAQAEQARLKAERAEERAQEARGEVLQQEAFHEDQVRAADRLDPDVDHTSTDYTPDTVASNTGATGAADEGSTHAGRRTTGDPETIFDSRDSDTTDTTHGRATDPDQRDGSSGGTTGGAHRA